ncbi:hypothetical protein EW146_g2375 [Bondarzewia mesenterica]|uniref:Transmembrane protein n=1 Tax=Bondarzewia mesenterica TaxID=1095465 RepID=A0A4S4M139_9AGAM|nr:hypothetical protein EW146_g2375 [Bondarzewia mesenterica]
MSQSTASTNDQLSLFTTVILLYLALLVFLMTAGWMVLFPEAVWPCKKAKKAGLCTLVLPAIHCKNPAPSAGLLDALASLHSAHVTRLGDRATRIPCWLRSLLTWRRGLNQRKSQALRSLILPAHYCLPPAFSPSLPDTATMIIQSLMAYVQAAHGPLTLGLYVFLSAAAIMVGMILKWVWACVEMLGDTLACFLMMYPELVSGMSDRTGWLVVWPQVITAEGLAHCKSSTMIFLPTIHWDTKEAASRIFPAISFTLTRIVQSSVSYALAAHGPSMLVVQYTLDCVGELQRVVLDCMRTWIWIETPICHDDVCAESSAYDMDTDCCGSVSIDDSISSIDDWNDDSSYGSSTDDSDSVFFLASKALSLTKFLLGGMGLLGPMARFYTQSSFCPNGSLSHELSDSRDGSTYPDGSILHDVSLSANGSLLHDVSILHKGFQVSSDADEEDSIDSDVPSAVDDSLPSIISISKHDSFNFSIDISHRTDDTSIANDASKSMSIDVQGLDDTFAKFYDQQGHHDLVPPRLEDGCGDASRLTPYGFITRAHVAETIRDIMESDRDTDEDAQNGGVDADQESFGLESMATGGDDEDPLSDVLHMVTTSPSTPFLINPYPAGIEFNWTRLTPTRSKLTFPASIVPVQEPVLTAAAEVSAWEDDSSDESDYDDDHVDGASLGRRSTAASFAMRNLSTLSLSAIFEDDVDDIIPVEVWTGDERSLPASEGEDEYLLTVIPSILVTSPSTPSLPNPFPRDDDLDWALLPPVETGVRESMVFTLKVAQWAEVSQHEADDEENEMVVVVKEEMRMDEESLRMLQHSGTVAVRNQSAISLNLTSEGEEENGDYSGVTSADAPSNEQFDCAPSSLSSMNSFHCFSDLWSLPSNLDADHTPSIIITSPSTPSVAPSVSVHADCSRLSADISDYFWASISEAYSDEDGEEVDDEEEEAKRIDEDSLWMMHHSGSFAARNRSAVSLVATAEEDIVEVGRSLARRRPLASFTAWNRSAVSFDTISEDEKEREDASDSTSTDTPATSFTDEKWETFPMPLGSMRSLHFSRGLSFLAWSPSIEEVDTVPSVIVTAPSTPSIVCSNAAPTDRGCLSADVSDRLCGYDLEAQCGACKRSLREWAKAVRRAFCHFFAFVGGFAHGVFS